MYPINISKHLNNFSFIFFNYFSLDRTSVSTILKKTLLFFSSSLYLLTILMWVFFDPFQIGFFLYSSFSFFNTDILLGVDGISILFLYMTSFIFIICMINSWDSSTSYLLTLFAIEIVLFFCFLVLDFFFFYIFFELVLIPFFFLLSITKYDSRKVHAFYLLFFYTVMGSVFMVFSILLIYFLCGTGNILILKYYNFGFFTESLLWWMLFISISVKVPIVPFHVWLPEAHVEASTEGSIILAAILLKLGSYALLRFFITVMPQCSLYYSPFVFILCLISIISSSFTAFRQIDSKRVIAYSSIAHMNLVTLGLFTFDSYALYGSILYMISHGFVSAGLFFSIGVLYKRYHTKLVFYYGGVVQTMPLFATFMFIFTLGNISFPLTSSFVAEVLIMVGIINSGMLVVFIISCVGVFLGSVYSFVLLNKVLFVRNPDLLPANDYDKKELFIAFFLLLHILLIGLVPSVMFSLMDLGFIYYDFTYLL